MEVNVFCDLEKFREFMILSTCNSFIPEKYWFDERVFPERANELGTMYVEAEDKVTLEKIRDITFVQVTEILGIIYHSKSNRTQLKWRIVRQDLGKLSGKVTTHSLVNLFASKILDESYVNQTKVKTHDE
jgi:hypothetical protein